MTYEAVLFDLGGVVFDSPFDALAAYEREGGLAHGAINAVIVGSGPDGAWGRNERGEITPDEFLVAFQAELERAGFAASAEGIMSRVGSSLRIRPSMIRAIDAIRAAGLKVAAVTNNWAETDGSMTGDRLTDHFDVFVASAEVGINKPDPAIYQLALDQLEVSANQAIFLDDIGRNLKSAQAMGITTIKVGDPNEALAELGELLGMSFPR